MVEVGLFHDLGNVLEVDEGSYEEPHCEEFCAFWAVLVWFGEAGCWGEERMRFGDI